MRQCALHVDASWPRVFMFTEQQLRENYKRQTTVLIPSMVFGVLAVFLYFPVVDNFREVWVVSVM